MTSFTVPEDTCLIMIKTDHNKGRSMLPFTDATEDLTFSREEIVMDPVMRQSLDIRKWTKDRKEAGYSNVAINAINNNRNHYTFRRDDYLMIVHSDFVEMN